MKKLSIEAQTPLTGAALFAALGEFGPELVEDPETGAMTVEVELDGRNDAFEVLRALENYVSLASERVGASLAVELDGRPYELPPRA